MQNFLVAGMQIFDILTHKIISYDFLRNIASRFGGILDIFALEYISSWELMIIIIQENRTGHVSIIKSFKKHKHKAFYCSLYQFSISYCSHLFFISSYLLEQQNALCFCFLNDLMMLTCSVLFSYMIIIISLLVTN